MNPLVSVIIPVYNGTNFLHEAINSALAQTFSDYEILVIDDGSTDKTWEIIKSYGNKVRGFHKDNGGVASALNLCIREMQGKYFTWLSHDDLWLPEKLEKQVAYMESHPQFNASYTDYYEINESGSILREVETPWYPKPQSIKELFGRMYIGGCTMMVERSCFDSVGLFNEKLKMTQDGEMWLRILNQFDIGRVPEKLIKERLHNQQGSQNIRSHQIEAQYMFSNMFEVLGLKSLFPEIVRSYSTLSGKVKGYIWLGDIMSRRRGWFDYADQQYFRAIKIYPSWNNPARIKILINQLFRFRNFSGHLTKQIWKRIILILQKYRGN
jgi:glycosyltransferase involved in cell wall biosynthesis